MAEPLVNRVKGTRKGLRPHTTFQDALGAKMTHRQQRQGGQQLRLPRTLNQVSIRHPLSQANTYDPNPTQYGSLSATNPHNHKSQSQSRPSQ